MKKRKKTNIPRHKRMKRPSRLQAAKHWIPRYEGKNIVKGYSKHFGVDKLCAVKELELLGIKIDSDYVRRLKQSLEGQKKARELRRLQKEQEKALNMYTDSDETFSFIAGYTSGGVPFGVTWDEMETDLFSDKKEREIKNEEFDVLFNEDEDIPF